MDDMGNNTSGSADVESGKSVVPLRDRASRTMKMLWTGVGALATLGGVLGLIQVISSGGLSNSSTPETAQDKIVAMVESGNVSLDEAERLARILYQGEGAPDSDMTEAIQTLAASGSDRQKEALALMAERHTRKQGLDMLEAEAQTSEDWRLVAELAASVDPERALVAIRKAIALDPQDFRSVTLLSQIQSRAGDYASAERSARTAELLASTPTEKVLAAQSSLNILIAASNVSDIPAARSTLETNLENFGLELETTPVPARFDSGRTAEAHPLWVDASANQSLAQASLYMADYEAVERYSLKAIEDFETISGRVPLADTSKINRRIASIYDNRIYAVYAGRDWPEVMRLAREQLDIYRDLAEAGDKRVQSALPSYYGRYSGYATYAGEPDIVRSASSRAVKLARLAADRRPEDARLALNVVQYELAEALALASIGDEVNLVGSLDKTMTSLEDALRGQPDASENSPWTQYSSLLVQLSAYLGQDEFDIDEDPTDDMLARAEVFLDQEIATRPEAHDPRHARNSLYLTMGDQYGMDKNFDKAREFYQRAYDDAASIPPTEKEPDVVALSELVALQRIVAMDNGVDPADKPEFEEAMELAQRLDREGKLVTAYQSVLSYLIAMRDGTMPDFTQDEE